MNSCSLVSREPLHMAWQFYYVSLVHSLSFCLCDYFTPPPSLSSNLQDVLLHPNFLLQTLIPFTLRKLKQWRDFLLAFLPHVKSTFMCIQIFFLLFSVLPSNSNLVSCALDPIPSHSRTSVIVLTHSCIIKFCSSLDHSQQHTLMKLLPPTIKK